MRPSRKVFDAALEASALVCFFGALVWLKELPAAVLDDVPVLPERKVLDALLAAFLLVTFLFVGISPPNLEMVFVSATEIISWCL